MTNTSFTLSDEQKEALRSAYATIEKIAKQIYPSIDSVQDLQDFNRIDSMKYNMGYLLKKYSKTE